MTALGKMLIIAGCVLVAAGLVVLFAGKIPFLGKLPGDIAIHRERFSFYFPLTTSILLSIILSILFSIFRK